MNSNSMKKKNEIKRNNNNERKSNQNLKNVNLKELSENTKNLNKMLKDYQNFCQKYFGDSTPIAAMSQERLNSLMKTDIKENEKNNNVNLNKNSNSNINLSMLDNDDYDFYFNGLKMNEAFDKIIKGEIIQLNKENKIGFEKNDKNDSNVRKKRFIKKQTEKINNQKNNNNNKIDDNIKKENQIELKKEENIISNSIKK